MMEHAQEDILRSFIHASAQKGRGKVVKDGTKGREPSRECPESLRPRSLSPRDTRRVEESFRKVRSSLFSVSDRSILEWEIVRLLAISFMNTY